MKLAVIGTGLLGSEIAIRLQDRRFEVCAWNRSSEKANALATVGIRPSATANEALAKSNAAILLLSDAEAIRSVLFPADSDAPPLADRTLIQMGTIAPNESRALGRDVERAGGQYLEAPVLGSLPEARSGRLIVMAGGELGLYERCLPIFEALSEQPQRIGEVGQGAALKLAMNQLIAGLTATFAYSLGLVRDEGIDVEQFMGLLRQSALYAPTFDKKLDKYLSHEYGQANFPLKHLRKDIGLFRRVAEQSTLETQPIEALEAVMERALQKGLGDLDYSALYEALVERR
ncbi:MAG: NAD-binding protein [Gammaproteobacteria bacterium]|jgi:3-hydroxyisobutyrate dehydrogenase|nr:NAD-binding protein [Gammaproteobacteria bacterium]